MIVRIVRKQVGWDGSQSEVIVGDYDGHLELRDVVRYDRKGGALVGKGLFIVESEIDGLEECWIEYGGRRWKVVDVETFFMDGAFHHHEIIFM